MPSQVSTFAPWAAADDLPVIGESVSDTDIADALQVASDVLFQFTGRRWPGVGSQTVRPAGWCHCASTRFRERTSNRLVECTCQPEWWGIVLPYPPIIEITNVTIEGATVDPSEYRLDNERRLVRLRDVEGNRQAWPAVQDFTRDAGDVDTWSVTYTHGITPPIGGKRAAVSLAEQLLRGWCPDVDGCRLPKRVQAVTRQGVTLAMLDPMNLFDRGQTGLAEVDLWVASVNRGSERRPGAVIDVAGGDPRRRFRRSPTPGS